jgi:hypothetical protein
VNHIENNTKKELSNYVSHFLRYETLTMRSLLKSLTVTDTPKALELRNKDRVALVYAQNGKIVHAIESHFTMPGEGFIGRAALLALLNYESINFKEFHCTHIVEESLNLFPHEIFDTSFRGENIPLETIIKLIGKHPVVELAAILNSDSTHSLFYSKSPDNHQMLSQDLLAYTQEILDMMKRNHIYQVDNIQVSLTGKGFEKLLIKKFGDQIILIFLQHKHVAQELLISFDDMLEDHLEI